MNSNRKVASSLFAAVLRDALIKVFGRVPSAAKLADAFNLRARGTTTITRETARKWLLGDAMPEIGKMRVLITWLDIDPLTFLQSAKTDEAYASDTNHGGAERSIFTDVRENLQALLADLDDESLKILYLTALAIRELRKKGNQVKRIDPANFKFVIN
jgi:transcriptional regulator with XRE-family HTH domain